MTIYLLEVGKLLEKDHKDYDFFSQKYDGKHGYYDQIQMYKSNYYEAVSLANSYIKAAADNTYVIVSRRELKCNVSPKVLDGMSVTPLQYDTDSVVFSAAKENYVITENFVEI